MTKYSGKENGEPNKGLPNWRFKHGFNLQRLLASLVAMVARPKPPNFDKEITKPKINLSSFKPFNRPPQATHLPQLARVRLGNMTRQSGGIAGIIANMTS